MLSGQSQKQSFQKQSFQADSEAEYICTLKWFNTAKGYGFLKIPSYEGDIFLHASLLQKSGYPLLGVGAVVKCTLTQTESGFSVSSITELISSGDSVFDVESQDNIDPDARMNMRGMVKWYDTDKKFGFITPDDGLKDVFVHKACLDLSEIEVLEPGQNVRVTFKTVRKGREATDVKLIETH